MSKVAQPGGGLLMTHQDMLEFVLLEDFVVDVEHGTTGVAKHMLDVFFLKTADEDFRASDFH